MENNRISILGCGWYGLALAKKLISLDYAVAGSTTSKDRLEELKAQGIAPFLVSIEKDEEIYDRKFFECDILFIAIPPKSRSPLVSGYAEKIDKIAQIAAKADVKQVIMISSSGIFEDGNSIINEHTIPQPNTDSGIALLKAENVLKSNLNFTTTIIRFSGLIGPGRNLGKHFAGKEAIPNGLAPINLIHLTDCLNLSIAIIAQKAFGKVYHGVGPSHLARQEFYTKACIASGLEKPHFVAELKNWKQIESKNVPEVLAYKYVYENWDKYFEQLAN